MAKRRLVSAIHLYSDPSSKTVDMQEIARYLKEKFRAVYLDVRDPLFSESKDIIRKFASSKVRDIFNPDVIFEPLPGEIDFERKFLSKPSLRMPGILYDGYKLQDIFLELLPEDELTLEHIHIIFTSRLFGTFDEADGRYHACVGVYGFPSLISTSGIVEAPAKPKEYYTLKQRYMAVGDIVSLEKLNEKFAGRFIGYDDSRLTEVMKGYVMQAIFYHIFGDPFCPERNCRLFNAHWQEEVIAAQLAHREKEFCDRHANVLSGLGKA